MPQAQQETYQLLPGGGVRLTRRSPLTGRYNTMDLPCTHAQFVRWQQPDPPLVHVAFPTLNADQREFVLSGSTPEDWAKMFPPEGDE